MAIRCAAIAADVARGGCRVGGAAFSRRCRDLLRRHLFL